MKKKVVMCQRMCGRPAERYGYCAYHEKYAFEYVKCDHCNGKGEIYKLTGPWNKDNTLRLKDLHEKIISLIQKFGAIKIDDLLDKFPKEIQHDEVHKQIRILTEKGEIFFNSEMMLQIGSKF